MTESSPTAAVLIIGDEILSGRTQDTNLNTLARFLAALGIDLMEARTVGDRTAQIVEALNALRAEHDYVFTTGGIGPTHDDITADAVATAFGAALPERQRYAFTTWGLRDIDTWLVRPEGKNRPDESALLLDAEGRPNPAYQALADAFTGRAGA